MGLERDSFGAAMITSVGSLGISFAIARIYPFARTPMMVCVGAVQPRALIREGVVVAGNGITITFTVDHRVVDGVEGAQILKTFQEFFLSPDQLRDNA
jgi:pyruvate dehydrogenase E2 component (dihydrolipoamide acetyltransferase)